jgi:TolB-like protein/tetratricopeptide (TPR) repeat protein
MNRSVFIKLIITIAALFSVSSLAAKNMTILVYPFKNTGDKTFSWVSAGMTDTVISDLGKIENINVLTEEDRKKAVKEMELAQSGILDEKTTVKVGQMLGANVIFTGSYLVMGNQIRVNARLLDVEKGKVEKSLKIDGTMDKIFEFQDQIVMNLMAETQKIKIAEITPAKFTEADKKRISDTARPDAEAFKLYSKGLELKDTNPKEALEYFKNAINIQADYTEAMIEAGITAGRELSRFQEAFEFLDKADKIFTQRGDTSSKKYAALMHRTGSVYLSKGDLEKSIEYLLKSEQIRNKLNLRNTNEYTNLLIEIGWNYFSRMKLDLALDIYFESKKLKEMMKLQNTPDYTVVLNVIGSVYYYKGQKDTALDYYLKSKKIREKLGLEGSTEYSNLLNNISNVYMDKGNPDAALQYLEQGKVIKEKLGLQDTIGYAFIYLNMGYAYERKGSMDKAGECFRKAYDIYEKAGYTGPEKKQALQGAKRLGR